MPHDPAAIREFFKSLPPEEIAEANRKNAEEHENQSQRFKENYAKGVCYLCELPFDRMSASKPCVHWLLRRCKFKKADFPAIYENFSYHNIAAFLRWCANQEALIRNINDLSSERAEKKLISYTIKWKNIEWTFDCSHSDFKGHGTAHSSLPHYHFQMRIDGRPFINFGDFHVPLTDEDQFNLSLINEPWFHHGFGAIGSGMEEAFSVDPDLVVKHTTRAESEGDAVYHLSTMVDASERPITGEELEEIRQESIRTGRSFASLASEMLGPDRKVRTVITPAEDIPDIAVRTPRKR